MIGGLGYKFQESLTKKLLMRININKLEGMKQSPSMFTRSTLALLAAGLTLTGCAVADAEPAEPDEMSIVVTSSIFGDIVQNIAPDDTEITVLIPAGSDPHEYAPSTRDIQALHNADLVISVGGGFEDALDPQLRAVHEEGAQVLELTDVVDVQEHSALYGDAATNSDEHDHDAHEEAHHDHDGDHDHDHDHGSTDPHFWHDPQLVAQAVSAIAEDISKLDAGRADEISQRTDAYLAELSALDTELVEQFGAIPEDARTLVTQHHVLGYLAQRYDFTILGAIIPSTSTLAQSSAASLGALAEEIEAAGARAIFTDVTQSDALGTTIQQELAGRVDVAVVSLYTESLSPQAEEAGTYLDMMRVNAKRITEALTVSP